MRRITAGLFISLDGITEDPQDWHIQYFNDEVTSLTAEAASFFSRRLGVKGQSGPQYVACGMFVGLSAVTTSLADEFRLGEAILGGCIPTNLAAVGGVPGINLDQCASSVFRFGAQYGDELAPASVTDTPVEPGLRPGARRPQRGLAM